MSGLGAAFGGSDELAKTKTEVEMSPEQRAAIAWRMGMVNDFLYPFARQQPGFEDIEYGAPGWDERARSGGIQYFANPPGDPFSLSAAGRDWTQRAQDYVGGAWQDLATNPFASSAGGWDNPWLQGISDEFSGALERFAGTAPQSTFTPERFDYSSVFNEGGDVAGLSIGGGGGASGSLVGDIDPAYAVGAAQDLYEDVTGPGITAAYAGMGQGRGGAELEALAAEGKKLALPISQQVLQHESQARLTEADLATRASIANAQIGARLREVEYLKKVDSALQAQMLTAKSDAQWNDLMAQREQVNAELQLRTNQLGADMAKTQYGSQLGLYGAGAQYGLEAPGAILSLMNAGLSASEMERQLARANIGRQTNLMLALQGAVPFPGGGTTTSTQLDTGNFWDKWNQLHSDYAKLAMSAMGSMGGAPGGGSMGGGQSMFG